MNINENYWKFMNSIIENPCKLCKNMFFFVNYANQITFMTINENLTKIIKIYKDVIKPLQNNTNI